MIKRMVAAVLCLGLAGCGFNAAIIKADSVAFNEVIEDATNKLMVLNVLRARDKAPLHFADIPVIRQSMQQSASVTATDFSGPLTGTTQRNSRLGTLGLQFSPSFEVTHLHSKEFNTGITSPIDPRIVKYWLDRGLDRRLVLLLFFSSAELIDTAKDGNIVSVRITNSPREAVDVIRARGRGYAGAQELRCDTQSDFERYLKLINALQTFFAHTYRERRVLARGVKLDIEKDAKNLQAFAALDQSKTQLVLDAATGTYNVYAVSAEPKVAFCVLEGGGAGGMQYRFITAGPPGRMIERSCFDPVVEIEPENSLQVERTERPMAFPGAAIPPVMSDYCRVFNRFAGIDPAAPKPRLRLHIRSVGEMFQFLGDLVYYQEELARLAAAPGSDLRLNNPVTFGYCPEQQSPGCDDVFIRLDDQCNARFSVGYRDRTYHVADFNPAPGACPPRPGGGRDHTLEVLGVLHQLIGLHRSATDLRQTPAVQLIP